MRFALLPLWVLAALTTLDMISIEIPRWLWPVAISLCILYLLTLLFSSLISPGEKFILEAPDDSIIKRKLGWTAAPDKLENWLEEMELQGCRLHKVEGNKFYYTKSRSRKVKYAVDYQIMVDKRYYRIHAEAGWDRVFSGYNALGGWTIWAREYQDEQPPQSLYSDKSHLLSHALRVAVSTTLAMSLYLPWSFTLAKMEVDTVAKHGISCFSLGLFGFFGTVLLLSCIYTVRVWLYYRRLRRLH